MNRKILTFLFVCLITLSCGNGKLTIYLADASKGQEITIDLNDGAFIYNKIFKEEVGENIKVKRFYTHKDSIKIWFKVNEEDTTIQIKTGKYSKIMIGEWEGKFYYFTNEDEKVWTKE